MNGLEIPCSPLADTDGFVRVEDALPALGTVCLVKTAVTGDRVFPAVYHLEGDADNLDDYHWSWHARIARAGDGYVTQWKSIMSHLDQWLSAEVPPEEPDNALSPSREPPRRNPA